jgi:hydrogenase expression/formation protein HypE
VTLPAGKVPSRILTEVVFKNLGARRAEVLVGPSHGLDGAVIEIGRKAVVTSMDPITGAIDRIGWLAVNINANDVATFGVQPAFFSSCLLLPRNSTEDAVQTVCRQIDAGARDLGMAVVGGHSESTPNLQFPIVVGCCMGTTEREAYTTAGGAKPGNEIILTKTAGIEGTAILASDRSTQLKRGMGMEKLRKAQKFFRHISVVKEAILAFQTGHVTAMHDPTEGGVAGGIHEMADASKLGCRIYEEKIRIAEETLRICELLRIDPLQLIASGSLLIAEEKGTATEIVKVLGKNKITAVAIGELLPTPTKRLMVRKDGRMENLVRPLSDHLWLGLER